MHQITIPTQPVVKACQRPDVAARFSAQLMKMLSQLVMLR